MKKKWSTALIGIVVFLYQIGASHASTININAVSNNYLNPVNFFFTAGTYDLTPIGVANGGAYNAFSTHYSFANSWLWRYTMSSAELGVINVNHIGYSPTEMAAFATAVTTSFTLTADASVSFAIYDGPGGYAWSGDNVGGISLATSVVPVPSSIFLLGSGLLGIGFVRRRLKK